MLLVESIRPISQRMRTAAAAIPTIFLQGYAMGLILLIILILVVIGAFPRWPHSRGWGYGPSGIVGLIVIVLIIMLLTGRL